MTACAMKGPASAASILKLDILASIQISGPIAAQPQRPDIARPTSKFVLACLAIGSFPAIFDGAVEDLPEKRNLVEQQAFHRVQGRHEFEPRTQPEHSCVQLSKPAERAVLAPGHIGEMVIPHQEIRVRADRTH